jgi:CII-binding regulator of phage lambda lysogenization HflD
MSKAAQGFSLRRTGGTPQMAFSQAAGANPRRTLLIGKRAIYGWKQVKGSRLEA